MRKGEIDGATGVILMAIGFMGSDWRGIIIFCLGGMFLTFGLFLYFKSALRP